MPLMTATYFLTLMMLFSSPKDLIERLTAVHACLDGILTLRLSQSSFKGISNLMFLLTFDKPITLDL